MRKIFSDAAEFLARKHRHQIWMRVVGVLACVVVFCTTYALILPAITMETVSCGLEEHIHTEECYAPQNPVEEKKLICTREKLGVHEHTESCYDSDENLVCGYADYVVHNHTKECYGTYGELVCDLEEITDHVHTDECYVIVGAHTHTDDCYTMQQVLICEIEENEEHTHGDECYEQKKVLTCDLEESEGERELICDKLELHTHIDDCYDESHNLICGEPELKEHQHGGEACFETSIVPDDADTLTCGLEEDENHTHTKLCYGTWTVTCGMEEHEHTESCYTSTEEETEEQADTASEEITGEAAEAATGEDNPEVTIEGENTEAAAEGENAEEATGEEPEATTEDGQTDPTSEVSQEEAADDGGVDGESEDYGVALLDNDEETDESTAETTAPLNVEDYVTNATLSYRTDDNSEWQNVNGVKDIPGDADFRLDVSYKDVPIKTLLAADGKMTYTLPDLLRNPTVNGKITSGSKEVGTIEVNGNVVTLSFNKEWLKEQNVNDNSVISGDFYVEAEADLSKVEDGKPAEIQVGNVTITIDFDDNVIAKYGNVDIVKSDPRLREETDGDYLEYTLTVAAGEDGCPDVKVVDTFTANQSYVVSYVGVTGTTTSTNGTDGPQETMPEGKTPGTVYIGEAPTENKPIPDPAGENVVTPGTLVWCIGNMAPGETRTLTYKVKLDNNYTGAATKGNIQNTATVYSQTYERDSDTKNFEPKAGFDLTKQVQNEVAKASDGGYIVNYTIWVQANADNTYTLYNVKIIDALDGSLQSQNATDSTIRKYSSYIEDSFHLFNGGSVNQNGSKGLKEITGSNSPEFTDSDNDGKNNDRFTYSIGPLAPGECRTLTYQVHVAPGAFVEAGNAAFKLNNRANVIATGKSGNEQGPEQYYNRSKELTRKVWDRKLSGDKQNASQEISISGDVYDATGDTVTKIESFPNSFTVPAGSYQYQVVANEAGDWNLSSASMSDSLGNQYMKFVGYVRVDAYSIDSNVPASSLADEAVIKNLESRTPARTVWVKVDNLKSFSFTPEEIGLNGSYAYLLTYYAQPTLPAGVTQVVVDNTFSLSGKVIIGDASYIINAGIKASASVTVEGSNSFSAEKMSWYYETPKVTSGDWSKGALYWAIQVNGNTIPSGTCFQDLTSGTTHYIRNDSLVGICRGSLNGQSVTDFDSWEALSQSGELTSLEKGTDYSVIIDSNQTTSMKVKLTKDITLSEGESVYIIIKTEPSALPAGKRDSNVFNNKLQSSYNDQDWIDHNMVSKTLYGSEGTFKELGRVFTYAGSGNITDIKGGTNQAIDTTALNGAAGTFVAWQIHVNYEGNLSGRYRVIEQIPDGMEVAYVRIWWVGSSIRTSEKQPKTEQITTLGDNWTEHVLTSATNCIGNQTTYYYTNGQQVIWEVGNLFAGNEKDNYAVEYQIVCRVTDPAVLLGGETKEFNNTVTLQNEQGNKIGSDSNSVSIQKQTLSKTGTYDPDVNGGRYPFKITLNELGEDLIKGADTITVVDELSNTLMLDTTSIKVINTKTEDEVNNWTSSVNGQTLKLVVPDNLPLTITYEAAVNAAPGQSVSIQNSAHWEGYTTPSSGSVSDDNFTYATGGTVGVDTNPYVKIIKMDQNNNQVYLSGATFALQEMSVAGNNTLLENSQGLSLTGTTAGDGTLTFGKDGGNKLQYNTVYRLVESKAPEGYVLDSTPHYFAIAKELENGVYPEFPDGVKVWYQGAEYTWQAYNHKGEAYVEKKFRDAGNQSVSKIDGSYRFGIYTAENPTGKPLQTVIITYSNGTTDPENGKATFTNLTLGATYYIYELDDNNQPIKNNALATVDGKSFDVSYNDGSAVKIPSDGSTAGTVTVTNQVHYTELPETGGPGTLPFRMGGLLLIAVSLLHGYSMRRKSERRSDS